MNEDYNKMIMMSLTERLQQDIHQNTIQADESQLHVAGILDKILEALINKERHSKTYFHSLFKKNKNTPIKGVYLWGGVGRGKTYLMDLFYEALPFKEKKRLHFHHFMQAIHHSLQEHQGTKNPLEMIAKQWAKNTKVLCFDEFFVDDIVDAMLLGTLLKYLFHAGVVLMTTSNQAPENLYKNGLQRDKFLAAIELINQYTTVLNIDEEQGKGIDYRLRILQQAELYHYPIDRQAMSNLEKYFNSLVPHTNASAQILIILERPITTLKIGPGVVWFDFDILCASARSVEDYIEIAKRFHTVFISNVPQMDTQHEMSAKRFIHMIDTFYDRNIKVVICAQCALSDLYQGVLSIMPFERTKSRLIEMQSQEYLAKPHLLQGKI